MNILETGLPGLMIVEPAVFGDERGYFFESYNEAAFAKAGLHCRFVQDNQSRSRRGVIRGLHAQRGEYAQTKLVRVVSGSILDVAVDARKDSPAYGKHFVVELSGESHRQLFIPKGFLHGFSVLSEAAVVQYKCDALYNKDAEVGVRYDDPALGIDWRVPKDVLYVSEKDRTLGEFSACCL